MLLGLQRWGPHHNTYDERKETPHWHKVSQHVNRDAADAQTKPEINEMCDDLGTWIKREMRSCLLRFTRSDAAGSKSYLSFKSRLLEDKNQREKRLTNAINLSAIIHFFQSTFELKWFFSHQTSKPTRRYSPHHFRLHQRLSCASNTRLISSSSRKHTQFPLVQLCKQFPTER